MPTETPSSEAFETLYPKDISENLIYRTELVLKARESAEVRAWLKAGCERSILFWMNTFVFTYNPRKQPADIPFVTYPFQDNLILSLKECVEQQKDLLVEKSRDMGVSWCVLMTYLWFWQFRGPGHDFLCGSRKEHYVDKLGDMDTLLEKIRFALSKQPHWLLPKGFDLQRDARYMNIQNPETNSTIAGESTNENFARGARRRSILFDEFAFWDVAQPAWRSAADTTNSRIAISTPHGLNNQFAKLRFSENIRIETLHWRLHPEKDEKWYEGERQRRNFDRIEIAQELDIDYEASEEGVMFPWDALRTSAKTEINYSPDRIAIGCDPSGDGEDEAVFYVSNNGNITEKRVMRGEVKGMELAAELVAAIHRNKAQAVVIDAIGNDVANAVVHLMGDNPTKVKIVAFKGSEKASDSVKYYNARAELYHEAAGKMKSGNMQVDDDYDLLRQLNATKYKKKDGKIIIFPKEDIAQIIGRSPDRADAWALTCRALNYTHSKKEIVDQNRWRRALVQFENQAEPGKEYGDWHDDPGHYV